ncbi:response regulator transcription factor [uncultured Clostridium sp.]|uniref:response regulator transcription factor n=1 Tax=uncultured Clostridium sp. TaxID=59620 RepID=UPI002602484A|nr:response regulator transcription factor [uncultured Clostridium sp.]
MAKIGIIEDDEIIRDEILKTIQRYGYEGVILKDFENIINEIENTEMDLILLDINLPYFDGYHICREIRKFSQVPIIIVTSRNSDMDELMSINIGADDFVTKPYNLQVLLARIERLLVRSGMGNNNNSDTLEHRGIKLNLSRGVITYNDKEIDLTKNEIKIITYLMKNKEAIVSREDLMKYLWDSDYFVDDNTLSVNITRIRKKLAEVGLENVIETKRGMGYIMP